MLKHEQKVLSKELIQEILGLINEALTHHTSEEKYEVDFNEIIDIEGELASILYVD